MSTTTCIVIMTVCLILSGYFSATETAFSSANTTRLKTLAEKGNKRAALVCKLLERYDRLLSTILIGNNIVNIATAVGHAVRADASGPYLDFYAAERNFFVLEKAAGEGLPPQLRQQNVAGGASDACRRSAAGRQH